MYVDSWSDRPVAPPVALGSKGFIFYFLLASSGQWLLH